MASDDYKLSNPAILLIVNWMGGSAGRVHVAVGTTPVGLNIYFMFAVHGLLKFTRITLVRFLIVEAIRSVAGCT